MDRTCKIEKRFILAGLIRRRLLRDAPPAAIIGAPTNHPLFCCVLSPLLFSRAKLHDGRGRPRAVVFVISFNDFACAHLQLQCRFD